MWTELLIGAVLVVIVMSSYREGANSTLTPTPICPTGAKSEGNGMCIQLTGVSPDSNNSCPRGFEGESRLDGPYTFEGEFQEFDGKCIKYTKAACPSGYLVDATAGLKCIPDPHIRRNPGGATPGEDLEAKFQQQKRVYDNLVSNALDNNDATPGTISAIADAKAAMNNTLSEMLQLTEQTGRGASQDDLIERIMEIQRDYNGLLVATDKLETLRRIRQQQDLAANGNLRIYGLGFLIACVGLIIVIARKI